MFRFTSLISTTIILAMVVLFLGCSQSTSPVAPDTGIDYPRDPVMDESNRVLWGYYELTGDTSLQDVKLVPMRNVDFHLNARTFLENSPCSGCLQLEGSYINEGGNFVFQVQIMHPFPGYFFYTGFDVRGILIMDGSNVMPASGLVTSDKTLGDCELVNADGYTPLYNTVMYAPGSQGWKVKEYSQGKFASEGTFTGTLNGYKVYYNILDRHTYSPLSGGVIMREFEVAIPDGANFRLGYAIDASWAPPTGDYPYDDPQNDFPPEANQQEPYQISIYMGSIPPLGGNAEILIDVYDWQGSQTIDRVEVEAPAYFNGFTEAQYVEDGPDYTRYNAYVWNNLSPPGDTAYQVLVRISDTQVPDADKGLKSYQILRVEVPPDEPGQDIIVLADLTAFMLNPLQADNEVYLYNMVSYVPAPGSPAEDYNKILFYEGHGGTMWYDDTTTKSIVEAAGYEYIRHSNEPLHATEDEYKAIFIFMPGYYDHTDWFTDPEIEELKQFAENGGRLIPICERGTVHVNKDVYNKLLLDLGSGIQGTNVDWPYSITITQEFIFPDQITENVHEMYVQWPTSLTTTPIDKIVFILPDQYNNDTVMARSRIIID